MLPLDLIQEVSERSRTGALQQLGKARPRVKGYCIQLNDVGRAQNFRTNYFIVDM